MASKRHGTLYIGVTGDLLHRVGEHKNGVLEGFTKKYNVHLLFYYEELTYTEEAIIREKQLKKWNRAWNIELIEKNYPEWKDLYHSLV